MVVDPINLWWRAQNTTTISDIAACLFPLAQSLLPLSYVVGISRLPLSLRLHLACATTSRVTPLVASPPVFALGLYLHHHHRWDAGLRGW
jgi:hypothetical protein